MSITPTNATWKLLLAKSSVLAPARAAARASPSAPGLSAALKKP
jgi:hypothetical protein